MLSFEVPPDPSCSPNLSDLKTDERAQEGLALKRAKEEHHLHCFSIRDYVFTSRRNDIRTNWPFSEKSLQLCLKHGVHDLLPPFEPPDLLRSHISRNIVRSDCIQGEGVTTVPVDLVETEDLGCGTDDIKCKSHFSSDQSVLESLGPSESLPLESKSNANRKAKNLCKSSKSSPSTDQLTLQKAKNSISEASPNSGRATAPGLSSKNEKKVRLIVKLSTVSDYSRTEDIASNSSSITDTMASKVCPVCKTFSSTSNTTLNAHIDQCLAEESNAKEVVAKPVKHKVKPRKIRLMVDIIATAPCCTLEYLDRRNGSNWALDPTLVAPANDVCTESKRPKLIPEDIDDDGNEGAVYLDANGRKIRILSKFNDAPLATMKEDSKQMKDVKEIKEGKSNSVGKKKHFSKKISKYLEVRSHGKKKLRSFKAYRSEVHKTTERNNPSNDNEREESQSRVLISQDTIRTSELGPLKKWGCSKRTHILKKSRSKDAHMRLRPLGPVAEDQSGEGIRPNSDSSVVRSHIVKFLRSSEVRASSPRSKSLSNLVQKIHSGEKPLEPTKTIITSKFAGDLGDFESSPRSKGVEIHAGSPPDKHESSKNHHPFLLKAKNLSMLPKNTSFGRPHSHEKNSASKKFRKPRSTVESNKRSLEVSLDASDEDGSAKSRHLDKFDSPKMVKTVEKVSSGKTKMSAPKQGKEERFAPEKKSADVGIMQFGHVNANHELLNVDAQVVAPNDSGSTVFRVRDFVKDHPPSSDVLLGNTRSIIGTETGGDTLWQRSSDDDETSNGIVGQDNQSAMENVNYGETVTDAPSIQGLDVSLASPTADVPHENSSITSSGHLSAQDQPMQVDEEPSGSSFSATSTVSPTSTPRSAFRYLESENSFGGHFLVQDKPSLSPLNNKSLLKMDMEIPRQEMPCCCSRKEEASPRDSNPLRKIACSETMLRPTDKLMMGTSSNARMSISTPFGAPPTVRMEGLSVNIMSHSEATFKFPTRSDIGSASPSSRAQTVRLMGKDLTVATQDGEDDMMNVPNTPVTASSNHMNSNYLSLLGYPNPNPSLNQDCPYFHGVSLSSNSNIHQSMWGGVGGRSTAYDCMDTPSQQQRSMHEKLSSAFDYNMERTASEAAVHAREVIIIDDSSDPRSQVRAFSCLPSQDMFLPKQSDGVNLMIHPRSCPNGMSNNTTRRGANSECLSNILSQPFILSSPSHFYSPSFR